MPHDKFDNKLAVGDRVYLPAKVTRIVEGEGIACNIDFEVEDNPEHTQAHRPSGTCNSRLVEKAMPPEEGETSPGD